jgi:hypothetical protein
MYTSGQIDTILSDALSTLYKVQNQSERERYMDGDSSLSGQPPIIYSLYKAVKWGKDKGLSTDAYYGMAAYLFSKCQKALAGLTGITESEVTPPSPVVPVTELVYAWEFYVSEVAEAGIPSAGDTQWVNDSFVNRTLDVELGGISVPGIITSDGSVYYQKPYSSNTLRFYNLPGGLQYNTLVKVRAWATGS